MHPRDLAALRNKARFTQRDLAITLNVTIATISRWETGERAISLEDAIAFVRACGARLTIASADVEHVDSLTADILQVLPHLDEARRDDLAALVARWKLVKNL